MSLKLTKEQKLAKRWKRYAEQVDKIDRSAYGGHEDREGWWVEYYNGYPQNQKFTKDYGRRRGYGR